MSIIEAEMIRNAQIPFRINAEEDDEISIVSDTAMDPTVWSVLNKTARSLGFDPTITLMAERDVSYAEPTAPVYGAMQQSDLMLLATSKGLAHSDAGRSMIQEGKKLVLMSEISPETLAGPAAAADYPAMLELGKKIQSKWNTGTTVEIVSPTGTNLTADISEQTAKVSAGYCDDGSNLGDENPSRFAAFPDGEVPISPPPSATNGKIV